MKLCHAIGDQVFRANQTYRETFRNFDVPDSVPIGITLHRSTANDLHADILSVMLKATGAVSRTLKAKFLKSCFDFFLPWRHKIKVPVVTIPVV